MARIKVCAECLRPLRECVCDDEEPENSGEGRVRLPERPGGV